MKTVFTPMFIKIIYKDYRLRFSEMVKFESVLLLLIPTYLLVFSGALQAGKIPNIH
jgi:hypothetical protein